MPRPQRYCSPALLVYLRVLFHDIFSPDCHNFEMMIRKNIDRFHTPLPQHLVELIRIVIRKIDANCRDDFSFRCGHCGVDKKVEKTSTGRSRVFDVEELKADVVERTPRTAKRNSRRGRRVLLSEVIVTEEKEKEIDTRLPQSRAGGQGPYWRSLDHLGRSSEAKYRKNPEKVV